jgi:hypothetical protein
MCSVSMAVPPLAYLLAAGVEDSIRASRGRGFGVLGFSITDFSDR